MQMLKIISKLKFQVLYKCGHTSLSLSIICPKYYSRESLNAPECEAIHLTDIETPIECDTFVPPIDSSVFQPWYSSFPVQENGISYSFMTYVRIRNNNSNSNGDSKKDRFEVDNFLFLPKLVYERHQEYLYLRLVEDILKNGTSKNDRTGTGTLSKFGCQVSNQILIFYVICIYSFM